MNLQLAGKRALVTGASKGIGFACALSFAREGVRPVLVARHQDGLDEAAKRIKATTGMDAETVAIDLAHTGSCEALAGQVGDIDILVNNAGAIPQGDLIEMDERRWRHAWDLKVYGYINLTRAYLPRMKRCRSGVVVNIIGIAGIAHRYAYLCGSTANAALIAFTRAVGAESSRYNVRVFGVNPSLTHTERAQAVLAGQSDTVDALGRLPFGRMMSTDEVANLTVFGCSPLAGYLSGTVIDLDGGQQYASSQ